MGKQKPDFDYEALKKKTIEQFRSGKSLFGKDGAFAPLLKEFLEAALEAELDTHLDEEQRGQGNRKNGRMSKKLKTAEGTFEISTPRDRDGRILKIDTAGRIEEFYNSGSWVAGLHFDKEKNLIALSHRQGLISISPNKVATILADKDEKGNRFLIPNGLDIASDGKIYFTNTSEISAYNIKYGRKLILEMIPRGGCTVTI